jgi:hypothetical protein
MARGGHKSPQYPKFSRRAKSKNKTIKLLELNNEVLSKFK